MLGYIYYITTDADQDIRFNAENYYESYKALKADYTEDLSRSESESPLKTFYRKIYELGAVIGFGRAESGRHFDFSFKFSDVSVPQQKYLDHVLNNYLTDWITLSDGVSETTMTVDDFIRQLKPDVIYHVYEKAVAIYYL